jgi:hypothetical protein
LQLGRRAAFIIYAASPSSHKGKSFAAIVFILKRPEGPRSMGDVRMRPHQNSLQLFHLSCRRR